MRLFLCFALLLAVVVVNCTQTSDNLKEKNEGRIFLSTFTVILSTVTSTTTIGTTTTCTTSTSALKTCSVGRRRRGLFYDDAENKGHARRGLFYNDDEDYTKEESISVPVKRSVKATEESSSSVTIDGNWVPLTLQSGFSLPDGITAEGTGAARFKLAYGTSTLTTTATSTATRSLTATCASTTSFQLCSGAGK